MEDVARRVWTWLPLVAWAGVIIALSSRPAPQLPQVWFWQADKVVHFGIYSILGGLGGRAAHRSRLGNRSLVVLAACIAFGLFDEWYQRLIPGRSSDLLDALADTIGASAGFALVLRYHRARHVSRHSPLR